MKPISLTMQAFSSYGKKTTIDFTKTAQNLFLISGDTGSGKSTIFDAIVFALYGEASSNNNKKSGDELQSHYSNYEVEPYVELTFEEQVHGSNEIYKVKRVPTHYRKKQKGTGLTKISRVITLVMPDGTEYPQKEADKKIVEIIGLTKEQFMQVGMIAQGEFMDMLRAKTKEKKEIFRKLFDTEIYEQIVRELDKRIKDKNSQFKEIRVLCQREVGNLIIPEEYEYQESLAYAKKEFIRADKYQTEYMNTIMEYLPALCEELKEQKKEANFLLTQAGEAEIKANTDLEAGKGLKQSYDTLDEALKTLADCESHKEEIRKLDQRVSDIRDAYEIDGIYQLYDSAQKQVTETKTAMKSIEDTLPDMKESLSLYETVKNQKNEELRKAEGAYQATKKQVDDDLTTFAEIKNADDKLAKLTPQIEEADEAVKQANKAKHAFTQQEGQWKGRMEELNDIPVRLVKYQNDVREEEAINRLIRDAGKAASEVTKQAKKSEKALRTYEKAKAAFEKADEKHRETRRIYLDSQAGFIAKELVEGAPCPVCGSIHHPRPAVLLDEHREITRELVDKLAIIAQNKSSEYEQAAAKAQEENDRVEERKEQYQDSIDDLYLAMKNQIVLLEEDQKLSYYEEEAEMWSSNLHETGEELGRLKNEYNTIQNNLSTCDEQRERLDQNVRESEANLRDLKESKRLLEQEIKMKKEQLQYEDEKSAKAVLKKANDEKSKAQTAYDVAEEKWDKCYKEVQRLSGKYDQHQKALPGQEKTLVNRKAAYEAILNEKQIDEAFWMDVKEAYKKTEINSFEKKVREYNNKKLQAETNKNTALENIGTKVRPNMEQLEDACITAQQAKSKADDYYTKIRDNHRANRQVLKNLEAKREERESIAEMHGRLNELYERLGGKKKSAKMDIETFVQRYYLEQILAAANIRFREMSAGQFELRIYPLDKAGDGHGHGLDLLVYSNITGKEREVRTLSGGESFMAALSLALGMADSIQANSAAVNLDMMFIDEGFGSLDDHSRSQAIRVLKQMAGGSKLIGIISHVTELKQEIDDQLIITKDEKGSHQKWNNA